MCDNSAYTPIEKPIRVLCVFSELNRGGSETMCMNLYRHIDRTKVQFDFIKHSEDKGDYEDEITALGGNIYTAPRYKIYNGKTYKSWWQNHFEIHPEHKLVHGHFFTISAVYFNVAKKYGRITIGHSHTSGSWGKSAKELIKRRMQRKVEGLSDYKFACSKAAGELLFPNSEFVVLRNAIDTDLFKYNIDVRKIMREELSIQDDEIIIGTVGRMMPEKNPLGIVDIMGLVCKKNPQYRFLWVGDGPLKKEVCKKIKALGLENKFIFSGVVPNVNDYLQVMDAFVLPSVQEGLPVVLVEAQAAGLVCFISSIITKDVDITGRIHFLPVDRIDKWVDTIEISDLKKKDCSKFIEDSGYDIKSTAKWLESFYKSAKLKSEHEMTRDLSRNS